MIITLVEGERSEQIAVDGATIPWNELGRAGFLYEQDGKPIQNQILPDDLKKRP